jgi:hypothetical protein
MAHAMMYFQHSKDARNTPLQMRPTIGAKHDRPLGWGGTVINSFCNPYDSSSASISSHMPGLSNMNSLAIKGR